MTTFLTTGFGFSSLIGVGFSSPIDGVEIGVSVTSMH
jgi:hypothetical protein